MNLETAFDKFNKVVTPSTAQRRIADARVGRFTEILREIDPGVVVVGAGSWVRDTSLGPIHDVDLIVVFPSKLCADWDGGSGTAELALGQVDKAIQDRLKTRCGLPYVWKTQLRNHVVKCYIDSRMATESHTATGFSVEVMPAIRDGSTFRVPERREDRWRTVDPLHLKEQSARRQGEWKHYTAMVRFLKHWAREHSELHISPLAMEVLALKCLPHQRLLNSVTRTEALKGFFTSAAAEVMKGVRDPAGRSGEIAPRLDRRKARDLFRRMADLAATAKAWEKSDHKHRDDIAVGYLRSIFGKRFPKPSREWGDIEAGPERRRAPWLSPERPPEAREPWQPWELPPLGGRLVGPDGPPDSPRGPGPQRGDAHRRGPRHPDDTDEMRRSPDGKVNDGPLRPAGRFGGDAGGPREGSPGDAAAAAAPAAGGVPSRGPTAKGRGMPSPTGVTDSGISLRNPNGHRAAMPATPVAAPPAPRPEDPAG